MADPGLQSVNLVSNENSFRMIKIRYLPIHDSSLGVACMCDSGRRRLGIRIAEKPMTQPWAMMFVDTLAVMKHWKPEI